MNASHSCRVVCVICIAILVPGLAGSAGLQTNVQPDEALKRAIANEVRLRAAERDYFYRQEILVQTFGESNTVSAQLHRVSEMTFDIAGNRTEKILDYPASPLTVPLGILQPDFRSLLGVDLFFLTPETIGAYSTKFSTRQKVDDIDTYVFDVESGDPKKFTKRDKSDHLFKGRIWVDSHDLLIVKFEGQAVVAKDESARYPKFECYRENVEGDIWLPSLAYARDVLDLKRFDLPIKIEIKYTNFKRVKPRR